MQICAKFVNSLIRYPVLNEVWLEWIEIIIIIIIIIMIIIITIITIIQNYYNNKEIYL